MIIENSLWFLAAAYAASLGATASGATRAPRQRAELPRPLIAIRIAHGPLLPPRVAATAGQRAAGPRLFPALPSSPARPSSLPGLPSFLSLGKPGAGGTRSAGLGVSGAYDDPRMACSADCRDSIQANQSPGVARTVLAGAAAAGIGAGVVLLLTAPARSAKSPVTPALGVGVALQKISASAIWRF